MRVPSTARRSNQSILKETNPEYSLEGLMLKLKLQYFNHLMWRADSLEKTLMLGKTEGKGRERVRWLDSITNSKDMNLSKLRETVKDREVADMSERLNNKGVMRVMCMETAGAQNRATVEGWRLGLLGKISRGRKSGFPTWVG